MGLILRCYSETGRWEYARFHRWHDADVWVWRVAWRTNYAEDPTPYYNAKTEGLEQRAPYRAKTPALTKTSLGDTRSLGIGKELP